MIFSVLLIGRKDSPSPSYVFLFSTFAAMKSDKFKGYLFALIATLAFSNVYIFSKAALNEVSLPQFGVYWFAIGLLLIVLYSAKTKKLNQIFKLSKRQYKILVVLGVLEMLTTTSFFISINIISDPSVTSFLGNMYPVLLTIFGIIFLREKFSILEGIGAGVALLGAFVISYQGGTSLKSLFIPGTTIVFINALFAATASIVVKKNVKTMSPETMNINRSLWLLLFAFIMLMVKGQSLVIPLSALKNIAMGATFGPFIAILSIYYSFQYIEASRSSIVQALKGIFVLIGAWLYFHTFPLPHQVLGGVLTVLGVVIMTASKAFNWKLKI